MRHGQQRDVYQRALWFLIPVAVCLALALLGGVMWWVSIGW